MSKKAKKKVTSTKHAKKSRPNRHRDRNNALSYTRFLVIGISIFVLAFVAWFGYTSFDRPHVLGVSVLLAKDGGSDSSGGAGDSGHHEESSGRSGSSGGSGSLGGRSSNGGGISNSGSGSSNSGSNSSGGSNSGSSNSGGSGNASSTVQPQTFVDCIGPDGKHFQTSFKSCSELNNDWGHSNFSFTILKPISNPTANTFRIKPQEVKHDISSTPKNDAQEKPEIERHKTLQETRKEQEREKELESEGTELKIEEEENGLKVKVKKPDGTEVELEEKDALEQVNKELDDLGLKIEKTATNEVTLRGNGVEAETHLPISVNPKTKTITVTTPGGVKTVTVFPDQAVERVLQTGIVNSIETKTELNSSSEAKLIPQTTLTHINNEAAFQVKGFANKKVLGVFPVSFAKTVFVSAENGRIVRTDETLVSKLLELLSF